jgi:hypothetical protein
MIDLGDAFIDEGDGSDMRQFLYDAMVTDNYTILIPMRQM